LLNSVETVVSSFQSLGVGHSKYVVCLYSAVNSAVARDGGAKLQTFLFILTAIEGSDSFFFGLCIGAVVFSLILSTRCEWVLDRGSLNSEEIVDSSRRDRLLVVTENINLLWQILDRLSRLQPAVQLLGAEQ
jgi:hypothetical protein